ncbi:hypothetical protein [Gordonia hydrophobica]|uniref:ESX-1 secretion-associated protein n=1 Tax=Gordonia hydrophobica TaxID=40516 RepID=A0ABZ2U3I0_9ACTN|nr:hypothetical protein [Gordonia hydrophobica]MBM7369574.1 hypothetical protein [Gordonia hydrophobica]
MEDLVYLQELWQKRAAVAKECGEELGELAADLSKVTERNYFGRGCVEGESVFVAMRAAIDGGSESLVRLADSAESLAAGAEAAASQLSAADAVGAHRIARP